VDGTIHQTFYAIATPLGYIHAPIRDALNLDVMALRESGELEKLEKKWWTNTGLCSSGKEQSAAGVRWLFNTAVVVYSLR
jgi:hypothetical protein